MSATSLGKAPSQSHIKELSGRTSSMRFMQKGGNVAPGKPQQQAAASGSQSFFPGGVRVGAGHSAAVAAVSSSAVPGAAPATTSHPALNAAAASTSSSSSSAAMPAKAPAVGTKRRYRFAVDNSSTVFDASSGVDFKCVVRTSQPPIGGPKPLAGRREDFGTGAMVAGRRSFALFNKGLEAQASGVSSQLLVNDAATLEEMAKGLGFAKREQAARDKKMAERRKGEKPAKRRKTEEEEEEGEETRAKKPADDDVDEDQHLSAEDKERRRKAYADHPALNPNHQVGKYASASSVAQAAAFAAKAARRAQHEQAVGSRVKRVEATGLDDQDDDSDGDDDDSEGRDGEGAGSSGEESQSRSDGDGRGGGGGSGGFSFAAAASGALRGSAKGLSGR